MDEEHRQQKYSLKRFALSRELMVKTLLKCTWLGIEEDEVSQF